jgi:hypothetical protein
MGTDSPFWVPGEAERAARERLEEGITGLYGDVPAGVGPLLELSAEHVAKAFDAYAHGNHDLCDALIAEGLAAAGDVFAYLVERLTTPAWLARVDSPHWPTFVAELAFMVLDPDPAPAPPAPRPPAPPAEPVNLADELRAMGLM